MRKIVLLFLAAVYANVALSQEWGFGAKAGLNISKFTTYSEKFTTGIDAGFFGEYRINKFAIEADLVYSKLDKEFDYLIMPFKAKFYLVKGLNIFVGPQLDFYLSKPAIFQYDGGRGPDIRRVFASAVGGVGYKFRNGFNISAAYNQGLVPVDARTKSYTTGFHITVGWDILQSLRSNK